LREVLRGVPEVIRNPRTWPPILAACGIYTTFITFLGLWGVPYLTQVYGLARVSAATVVSTLAVGTAIGSPVVGWLSYHWLRRRLAPVADRRDSRREVDRARDGWGAPLPACGVPGGLHRLRRHRRGRAGGRAVRHRDPLPQRLAARRTLGNL